MSIAVCCYNDDLVWQELEKHEQRLSELETLCETINSDIDALQKIVKALDERDYLIKVKETDEDLTLTFARAGKIVINKYNSEDNDSQITTPVISMKQDEDGTWYWTSGEDWLLDQNGNRIPAQGKDGDEGAEGEDGVTPLVKIENGYWMVSYDDGCTWEILTDTPAENTCIFKEIKVTESDVTLILADGTPVVIPRMEEGKPLVDIMFSDMGVGMNPGATRQVDFTLANANENTLVKAVAQNGWRVKVTMTSVSEGYLTVTAPDPMEEDEIIVFVYDGNGRTIMKTINFVTGVISVSMETKSVSGRASEFSVDLETNLDIEIEVPSVAGSWITCQTTPTKAMNKMTCTFSVTDNFSGSIRTASVLIKDKNSSWSKEINIAQAIHDYLDFKDPAFQKHLVENFDTNNDGEINKNEAPSITSIKAENKGITSLEGISSLEALESLDVSGNALSKVDLSADVFWKLKDIDCSDNNITEMDLSGCRFFLENLNITGNPQMTLTLIDGQGAIEAQIGQLSEVNYIPDTYISTDYSKHEEVVTLQEHSIGNGIPVVFMGDGFTDRDIKTGYYDFRMRQAMEYMFSEEPYKTFRNMFDVKYVVLISNSRIFNGEATALGTKFDNDNLNDNSIRNSRNIIKYHISKLAFTESDNRYSFVIINTYKKHGAKSSSHAAYCSIRENNLINIKKSYKGNLIHELNGHHIGDVGDEYWNQDLHHSGTFEYYQNLSITNDPSQVPWNAFFELPEYSELVGVFEGGGEYYATGIWRSSETSVMRETYLTTKFNAVCRHIIYKKIMELSGEEYSWEAFLEYDKKNLADSPR